MPRVPRKAPSSPKPPPPPKPPAKHDSGCLCDDCFQALVDRRKASRRDLLEAWYDGYSVVQFQGFTNYAVLRSQANEYYAHTLERAAYLDGMEFGQAAKRAADTHASAYAAKHATRGRKAKPK